MLNGKKIDTAPMASYYKAREIAYILKEWIARGDFLLSEPHQRLASGERPE